MRENHSRIPKRHGCDIRGNQGQWGNQSKPMTVKEMFKEGWSNLWGEIMFTHQVDW